MNPLKQRNDEIYRRWKEGENHVDLAYEFDRNVVALETMLKRRDWNERFAAEHPDYKPGPSNKEVAERNRPRNEAIVTDRKAGMTWTKLGEVHGLSRERCRQIYVKHLRVNEPEKYREWAAGYLERSLRYRKKDVERREKYRQEYEICVRIFDKEEPVEVVARELGWTTQQMDDFIAKARAQNWVTMTEYQEQVKKVRERGWGYIPLTY